MNNKCFNTILETPYIINKNDTLILKLQIEPINKITYNFYLLEDKEKKYSLICSMMKVQYIIDEVNKYVNCNKINKSNLQFEEILNTVLKDESVQLYIKNNYSKNIKCFDENRLNKILEKIHKLDFKHKRPDSQGLDGFHLDLEIDSYYFHSWCYCNENYYEPIIELANYLLKLANIEPKYRFKLCKNKYKGEVE